jgi:hypothetical protein
MQRSVFMLLRGDLIGSIQMYPALLPMIGTFIFLFLHLKYRYANGAKTLMWLYISSVLIVVINYSFRQYFLLSQL